jgi:hypothetical protein
MTGHFIFKSAKDGIVQNISNPTHSFESETSSQGGMPGVGCGVGIGVGAGVSQLSHVAGHSNRTIGTEHKLARSETKGMVDEREKSQ